MSSVQRVFSQHIVHVGVSFSKLRVCVIVLVHVRVSDCIRVSACTGVFLSVYVYMSVIGLVCLLLGQNRLHLYVDACILFQSML